jgi:hypothetical protein
MLKGFVRLPAEVILIPYEAYLVIRDRRIITYRGLSFTHKQKKKQWKAEAAFHLSIYNINALSSKTKRLQYHN